MDGVPHLRPWCSSSGWLVGHRTGWLHVSTIRVSEEVVAIRQELINLPVGTHASSIHSLSSLHTNSLFKVWEPSALMPGHSKAGQCAFGMMKSRFQVIFET